MKLPVYLDYMSTTPIDPRVKTKMINSLDLFGNPTSGHLHGNRAREAIEEARSKVAKLINADLNEIIWTSGATEANNLALKGAAFFYQRQGRHIVTLTTEHKSVLDPLHYLETKGFQITYLNPDREGLLDLELLENSLQKDTILVSIMHVNNEIGVIQNIEKIGELVKSKGILFHVDAAQSAGKITVDVKNDKVDLISFSAHKIYGPKGVGALYVRHNPRIHLDPQIHGGGQEYGLRSGTLATHQIIGMGEAFRIARYEMEADNRRILSLRNKLWQEIKGLSGISLNGSLTERISGNLNVSFQDIEGELLLALLNKDLAISTGSACSLIQGEPSHVLKAIGVSDRLISSSIRFSIGRFTTEEEIEYAVNVIKEAVLSLYSPSLPDSIG